MNTVRIGWIGLAALFVLTPCANAQQANPTFSFKQTFQPANPSFPGVSPDILGVRTGMTVSQVEAIAEKHYRGKPSEFKAPDTFGYKEVTAQSDPFVQTMHFDTETADTSDVLDLGFTTPVTGDTVYTMTRKIKFYKFDVAKSAQVDPSVSAVKEALIKKYGPPSYLEVGDVTHEVQMRWEFTPTKSRVICKGPCDAGVFGVASEQMQLSQLAQDCGYNDDNGSPNPIFGIQAEIEANRFDSSKADDLSVSMTDVQACMKDGKEAINQLKTNAIKLYIAVSAKAPAAPKL